MNTSFLFTAQYINQHPILNMSHKKRGKYLTVLSLFTESHSLNKTYSNAVLALYQERFLGEVEATDEYSNLVDLIREVSSYKFKFCKQYRVRFMLLIDCLFVCSSMDKKTSQHILDDFLALVSLRYHKELQYFFNLLWNRRTDHQFIDQNGLAKVLKCWKSNLRHLTLHQKTILVTANKGSGKSTLINALIGKQVNRTMHRACTAKLHYIYNKPYEDGLNYEYDHILVLDADHETLMHDNENNYTNDVIVSTTFRTLRSVHSRICIVDTPGVNSAEYPQHRKITENKIRQGDFDKLVYIASSDNMGTDDEIRHLRFIASEVDHNKIIFVVNKLDKFKNEEDVVNETISKFHSDLLDIGFANPCVYPISAYAAWLAKKFLFQENMDEEEVYQLHIYHKKFQKPEFDFGSYHSLERHYNSRKHFNRPITAVSRHYYNLLYSTGISSLERILFQTGE